uniref:Uncharacterized protein n=1 Tax=uncultured bacterium fosmid pJB23D10 TaxID=1478061 RepID=A0A0H3U7K7_9BACT|nr:hypothetical protein [uncultured bacterium fosmid pJB23D10]
MNIPSRPYDSIDTIIVAITIPTSSAAIAFLISISSKAAMSEPIHAPVPGIGIPTNNTSPRNSPFESAELFFIALASSFSISLWKSFVFPIHLNIFLMKRRIKGIGIIFPTTQIGIATLISKFKNLATNNPALSSRIGIIETKRTTAQSGIYLPREFANFAAILSVNPSFSSSALSALTVSSDAAVAVTSAPSAAPFVAIVASSFSVSASATAVA